MERPWPWHQWRKTEVIPASQLSQPPANLSAWPVARPGELPSWPSPDCRIINKSPMPGPRGFPLILAQGAHTHAHYYYGITTIFPVFPDPGGQWSSYLSLISSKGLFGARFVSYKWASWLNNINSSHEIEFFYFALYCLLQEKWRWWPRSPAWNCLLFGKEGSNYYNPNKIRCML